MNIARILLWTMPIAIRIAAAQEIDREALYKHMRKSFSTPADMKFELKDLKPSPLEGFLAGTLEIAGGPQAQPILISQDGHYYFLSSAFPLVDSKIRGLRTIATSPQAPPIPVYVSPDGKYVLYGGAHDLTKDPDAENRAKIKLKGALGWGPENAPVVLVEYSDLQCPHCRMAHQILEHELPAYKDKVRWVFKHYPLTNSHPWAYEAAIAAACASLQSPKGARELIGSFFSEQATIQKDQIRQKALDFAKTAKLNMGRFERCLDKQESKPLVEESIAEGQALGVPGTPTIFVNGRLARNDFVSSIRPIIEEMLADKSSKP